MFAGAALQAGSLEATSPHQLGLLLAQAMQQLESTGKEQETDLRAQGITLAYHRVALPPQLQSGLRTVCMGSSGQG